MLLTHTVRDLKRFALLSEPFKVGPCDKWVTTTLNSVLDDLSCDIRAHSNVVVGWDFNVWAALMASKTFATLDVQQGWCRFNYRAHPKHGSHASVVNAPKVNRHFFNKCLTFPNEVTFPDRWKRTTLLLHLSGCPSACWTRLARSSIR